MLPAATAATARERVRWLCMGALEMKARSPVIAQDGLLPSNMMIKTKNTSMKDESGSIVWTAKLCSSLCIRTLTLDCTMSVSLPRILAARCY